MLEYLRNAADKPVAKILITILAFSFIGWGVAEWIFGGGYSDTTLVRVGGQSISVNQFNAEKSRELARMTREEMRAIYADQDASSAFQTKILTQLTTQQMAQNRAHDLGFVVSDNAIAREIREFPEFQINGAFSTLQFDSVLNASGYSEADFAAVLRNQVLRSMVLGPISVPMKTPQFAADALYNARYATRNIEYATVRFSDFTVGKPTEEDLKTFYAQNPHTVAEMRSVSYVLVPAEMDKPDSYGTGYDIAVKVEDDIIAGESMSTAAKNNNAKHVQVNAFDMAHRPADENLDDKMIARIFRMDEGAESELIETKHGFIIVRVDKVIPEHNAEFDDVKSTLADAWARDAARRMAYVNANEILVNLNDGKEMSKSVHADVTRTNGAPTNVLVAAFNNAVGTNTIVESDDAFYVLAVRSESSPTIDTKKMAEVRTELETMAMRQLSDDYNAFLMRKYPTKVNERVYKRFITQ
ncbi:MAG: SurA N-terminal domain-containing protein [Alphaproteobacteria bacterium]|nr:SurA N-terminal domain-containing protein [Alphaproteobacteria bacterium]